jgi:hypothetical protein
MQCEIDPGAQQVRFRSAAAPNAAMQGNCGHHWASTELPAPASSQRAVGDVSAPTSAFCGSQVLRKAFPGVLLVPDVCGLQRLPKVGPAQQQHSWR